jgi:hypothetical protein
MNAGMPILAFGGTVPNGGDSSGIGTLAGGVFLLLVGVVLLVAGSGRGSRLGAVGLILWAACLIIPAAVEMA